MERRNQGWDKVLDAYLRLLARHMCLPAGRASAVSLLGRLARRFPPRDRAKARWKEDRGQRETSIVCISLPVRLVFRPSSHSRFPCSWESQWN